MWEPGFRNSAALEVGTWPGVLLRKLHGHRRWRCKALCASTRWLWVYAQLGVSGSPVG